MVKDVFENLEILNLKGEIHNERIFRLVIEKVSIIINYSSITYRKAKSEADRDEKL